jgi:predicted phosphodiesterase
MELKEYKIDCASRSDVIEIIPLGDVHIGARNCAETPFKKIVKYIKDNKNVHWIGGGDYLEAIKPNDVKRYDTGVLPDWILEGGAKQVREKLSDLVYQQRRRFCDIVQPIAGKCIGNIEGNHEFSIRKNYNESVQEQICRDLFVDDLTDQALIRIKFVFGKSIRTIKLYLRHGHLTGRSAGAEPNQLFKMLQDWDCDIGLRGHSHNFHILPPVPVMYIPDRGELPKELLQKMRYAANWGCWKYSNMRGLSTYESRAEYNAKPILALKIRIKPFWHTELKGQDIGRPQIELNSVAVT